MTDAKSNGAKPAASFSAAWVLLALTAATAEPILVKIGYRGIVTPGQLLVFRTLFAAVAILPLTRRWRWIGAKHALLIFPVSVLLLVTNGLSLLALKTLSAVTVIAAVKVTPALVAIINQVRGRERLTRTFWFGFVLCFVGTLLTMDDGSLRTSNGSGLSLAGGLVLLGAIVSSAVYRTRLDVVLETVEPAVVSTYIFFFDAILVTVFVLPFTGVIRNRPASTVVTA